MDYTTSFEDALSDHTALNVGTAMNKELVNDDIGSSHYQI
jgi:hypothetical protein